MSKQITIRECDECGTRAFSAFDGTVCIECCKPMKERTYYAALPDESSRDDELIRNNESYDELTKALVEWATYRYITRDGRCRFCETNQPNLLSRHKPDCLHLRALAARSRSGETKE